MALIQTFWKYSRTNEKCQQREGISIKMLDKNLTEISEECLDLLIDRWVMADENISEFKDRSTETAKLEYNVKKKKME